MYIFRSPEPRPRGMRSMRICFGSRIMREPLSPTCTGRVYHSYRIACPSHTSCGQSRDLVSGMPHSFVPASLYRVRAVIPSRVCIFHRLCVCIMYSMNCDVTSFLVSGCYNSPQTCAPWSKRTNTRIASVPRGRPNPKRRVIASPDPRACNHTPHRARGPRTWCNGHGRRVDADASGKPGQFA